MIQNRPLVAALIAALMLPVSGLLGSCHTVPITGRKQLLLVPEGKENSLGAESYKEILSEEKVSTNKSYVDIVTRVGKRIAKITGEKDFDWEYKVIASETVNAFCLPGGKVAFYEGILPTCANEGGIAVVMGHEIGHAIARHGGERMSQQILVQMGAIGINIATRSKSEQKRLIMLGAYGAAANLGFILPFSRKQESEADEIGLMFMAMAGYDPAEAPKFWGRMDESGGGKVPAFLSTHPSHEKRAEDLKAMMADARKLYNAAKEKHGTGETLGAPKSSSSGSSGSSSTRPPISGDSSGDKGSTEKQPTDKGESKKKEKKK